LCQNFVQHGGCHATGGKCLLGSRGMYAKNQDGECELQGGFDVWLTERNELLITDLGFPSEEPKQCLALGVNEALARRISQARADELRTSVLTTQRTCIMCRRQYWSSEHTREEGLREVGKSRFCPNCMSERKGRDLEKLGAQEYWCG
jgi:hypothetical protein